MPMLNVFHHDGDVTRHFWASELLNAPTDPGQDPRHVGTVEPLWNLFDLIPEGRGTDWDEQLCVLAKQRLQQSDAVEVLDGRGGGAHPLAAVLLGLPPTADAGRGRRRRPRIHREQSVLLPSNLGVEVHTLRRQPGAVALESVRG